MVVAAALILLVIGILCILYFDVLFGKRGPKGEEEDEEEGKD
jgi:hypothetical protein